MYPGPFSRERSNSKTGTDHYRNVESQRVRSRGLHSGVFYRKKLRRWSRIPENANLPGKECPNCGPVEVVRECSHGPCILSLACRRMLAIILNFDKMDYWDSAWREFALIRILEVFIPSDRACGTLIKTSMGCIIYPMLNTNWPAYLIYLIITILSHPGTDNYTLHLLPGTEPHQRNRITRTKCLNMDKCNSGGHVNC